MATDNPQQTALIETIKALPPETLTEVARFVEFLAYREDRRLVDAAMKLSESSFADAWDNPEDADYDKL